MKRYNKNFLDHMLNYHEKFGSPEVDILEEDGKLAVHMYTENLHLENSKPSDVGEYYKYIYGDQNVMKTYGSGKVASREQVEERVKIWVDRAANNNPFIGLKVETLDEKNFSGLVVLGAGSEANSAELAYATSVSMWNKYYTTEAVGSVVFNYSRAITDSNKYKLPSGENFNRIISTALTESNPASNKILSNAGFQIYKTEEKFEAVRNFYELTVVENLGTSTESESLLG